jgi:hypothetical protein
VNKLQSMIAFICQNYPHKHDITKARLTKMVYLADWVSAILDGKQLTEIEWLFNHYGPYVDDVVEAAKNSVGFNTELQSTMYGSPKYVISFNGNNESIDLSKREKDILTAVIDKTKTMFFNDFINYIYSTYPVKTKERYTTLNLVSLAKKFKAEKEANTAVV